MVSRQSVLTMDGDKSCEEPEAGASHVLLQYLRTSVRLDLKPLHSALELERVVVDNCIVIGL